jgi:hypothetical protein
MASVFGLPCKPPQLQNILFGTSLSPVSGFLKSITQNPNTSMNKYERFFYSKFFLCIFLWYIVFRIPREMSHFLHKSISLNYTILLIVNVTFVFELFRRYGYECTVFLTLLLYMLYGAIMHSIPLLAKSFVGDAIPELKELEVSKKTPGLNHCRRLVVCRATPVYDNYKFQKGKHEKCMECASKSNGGERIRFNSTKKSCGSKNRDVDAKTCYECTENQPPKKSNCSYSKTDCANVFLALDVIDPPQSQAEYTDGILVTKRQPVKYNRVETCKKSHGSLCWFGKVGNRYRGWIRNPNQQYETFSLNDQRSKGKGFPTQEVCELEMSASNQQSVCTLFPCDTTGAEAKCACAQYKNVAQFDDPCKFLESNCDEKSMSYTEAKLRMKQADINVDDIVTIDDAKRFLNILDDVASKIP